MSALPVFSQLKSLARNIENGLELEYFEKETCDAHKGQGRPSSDSEQSHSAAVNEIRHKWKDIRVLKENTEKIKSDFELRNEGFTNVCELFEKVFSNFPSRLENIENYLVSYGYQRPPDPVETKPEDGEECGIQAEEDEDGEEGGNEEEGNQCVSDVSKDQQKPECPKLEDFLSQLSEETIMIFKGGMKTETSEKTPLKRSAQNSDPEYSSCYTSTLSSTSRERDTACEVSNISVSLTYNQISAANDYDAAGKATPQPPAQGERTVLLEATPQPPKLRTDTLAFLDDVNNSFCPGASHTRPLSTEPGSTAGEKSVCNAISANTITSSADPFTDRSKSTRLTRNKENAVLPCTYPEAPKLRTQDFSMSSFHYRSCESVPLPPTKSVMDYETPQRPELLTQTVMSVRDDNKTLDGAPGEKVDAPPKKAVRSLSAMSPPKPPKLLGSYSFFNN